MTNRYILLVNAYLERDHYILLMFGFAALILITDWATSRVAWLNAAFRVFLLAAFIGLAIYGLLNPGVATP